MPSDKEIKELLAKLTPDQLGVAKAIATLRIENRMLKEQAKRLEKDHKDLFNVMLVILGQRRDMEDPVLRIHESQFMRLRESYRIDRWYDEETREVCMKLLTVRDEMPKRGVDVGGTPVGN